MLADADLKLLNQRLVVRAAQLRQEIAAVRSRGFDRTTGEVSDEKDIAEADAEDAVADAEVDRDLAELHDITVALGRIADGTYGECKDCGTGIDPRRLVAHPEATRCVTCQAAADEAGGGDARRRA